jgi:hypothetical protein
MDTELLNTFIEKIKITINDNNNFNLLNHQLSTELINEKNKNNLLLTEQENIHKDYKNKIDTYIQQINELETKLLTLKKENSDKSSKTIWETTQNKLKEKDERIDELSRMIEFYKRTQNVLTSNKEINNKEVNK